MTEKIENQDVELQEDEEISEMKHDPKNAEAQSVASVDKAGEATGTAPKRKMAGGTAADNTKQDPIHGEKIGMMSPHHCWTSHGTNYWESQQVRHSFPFVSVY